MQCFNPHPTFRPDATSGDQARADLIFWFQPSSDLQAGCNRTGQAISSVLDQVFQPSSDLQAGCNLDA